MKNDIKATLYKLLKKAEKEGIEICVARDPEGNGYHTLKADRCFFPTSVELEDKIVLGVWEGRNDEELFNDLELI